jgi:hypothetical protein
MEPDGMWLDLLKGILGMLALVGGWLAIQAFARRRSECGADQDLLEYMAGGCSGCKGSQSCQNVQNRGRKEPLDKEEHHELV